jgi:hypothetical protein
MAIKIYKSSIVDYLDNRILELQESMDTYTTKGKYYQILQQQRAVLLSVKFNINAGMFDENIPDGLKQLHQWGEQSM